MHIEIGRYVSKLVVVDKRSDVESNRLHMGCNFVASLVESQCQVAG